jgi:DNA ligase-1
MLFQTLAEYYEKLESISSRLEMIDILTLIFKDLEKDEVSKVIYITQGVLRPSYEGIEIGVAEKFAEKAISLSTGFSEKEVIVDFKKTGDLGIVADHFSSKTKFRPFEKRSLKIRDVYNTMRKIADSSGAGSQNVKIKLLSELLTSSTSIESRYIIRFALGTLRLGVGDATILEALSKSYAGDREFKSRLEDAYNICNDLGEVGETLAEKGKAGIENMHISLFKPIRPALAERLPTAEEIMEKMHGKCAVESKYDGLRAQLHMDKKSGKVEIFSRQLERLTAMFPDICKAALNEIPANKIILEGEVMAYDVIANSFLPFQETIQRRRKHNVNEKSIELPVYLFAFDIMYVDGENYLIKPYLERRKKLESLVNGKGLLHVSEQKIIDNPKDLEHYFDNAIGEGLEGIVAKDLNSKYIAGARKFSWIKLKRSYKGELSDTLDLAIVGYYLGKGFKAEFKFGGLLCAVYNDKKDVFETITRIGTGFTEQQLKEFKALLDKTKSKHKPARVISKIEPDFWVNPLYVIVVKADEITRSPMHTCGMEKLEDGSEVGYALRFPRIISDGIREDKKAENANTTKEIIEMYNMQKKTKLE